MATDGHQRLSLERCGSCRGFWFDAYALDAVLKQRVPGRRLGEAADLMNPVASHSTTMGCPRCASSLKSHERAGITVEWCSSCRGLFLDAEALDRLIQWRRDNRGAERKAVAKDAAAEGARVAEFALGALIGEALGSLFGGTFFGRGS